MENREERLLDLISSKSFSELTLEEMDFVMQELQTKEAYHQLREAHVASIEALQDDVAPPTELKGALMDAFEEKESKKGGVIWWRYAALIAGVALGVYFFWPEVESSQESLIAENAERFDSIKNFKEVEETEDISVEPESKSERKNQESPKEVLIEKEVEVIPDPKQTKDLDETPQIAQIETTENFEITAGESVFGADEPAISLEMDDNGYPEEEMTAAAYDENESIRVNDFSLDNQASNISSQEMLKAQAETAAPAPTMQEFPLSKRSASKDKIEIITLKEIGGIDNDGYVAY
ncbi:MAG: hypothetical protein MK086_05620 [Flavobacteriales bacterium]|nr:hypothetical protein [Flavobacteriales bacterium]